MIDFNNPNTFPKELRNWGTEFEKMILRTVQGNVSVPKQKSHEENESRSQEECKQTKSASCKGRGFNKESESENHRMEELLFHQEKRKVDAGSRLVHYLHFYKMV